jgi:hypothetical protein
MTKNEIRRLKKGIELIELLLNEIKTSNNVTSVFKRRDSFHHVFYNGNRLDELFLYIFPVEKLEHISGILSAIETASGSVGDELLSYGGRETKKEELVSSLETINFYLQQSITSQGFNIFYSWQSDLQNNTNRSFIETALEKAVREVSKELIIPFVKDMDTTNRTGSPDIAKTILEKIDSCFMFVADISIITAPDITGKKTPNPNVLFELGYAQGVLGEENIIMVFNNAFGSIEDLPFDLRGKRIMQYSCHKEMSDPEKASAKSELVKQLNRAIKLRAKAEIR